MMATILLLLSFSLTAATPAGLDRLQSFTYSQGAAHSLEPLIPSAESWSAMGMISPANGARGVGEQSHLYESKPVRGPIIMGDNPHASRATTKTAGDLNPVGVGADFSYASTSLEGNPANSPDLLGPSLGLLQDLPTFQDSDPLAASQVKEMSSIFDSSKTGMMVAQSDGTLGSSPPLAPPTGVKPPSLQYSVPQEQQNQTAPNEPPLPSPSNATTLSKPVQMLMSNLFVMGLNKSGSEQQLVPEPLLTDSRRRNQSSIAELSASLLSLTTETSVGSLGTELRAPCDLLVDVVFALDDMDNLWLVTESIRFYETQLLPSRHVRFGVVLCGQQTSFYTALHGHFSGLLASLEDLQHANATLEPSAQMPDTPGYRSENNPYPPRVSEDFTQTNAGCLETVYHLFDYQSKDTAERLLTVVATKERWANSVVVDEAYFLHSLNISILSLAGGDLSTNAQDSLRKMASAPDKFRSISDNVTLHALPAMIGSAICRPQKADVTVTVHRTAIGKMQEPVVKSCRQLNSTSLERSQDFGGFFGLITDHVQCVAGLVPDPVSCACV